jgi:hypothetical protein
MPKKKLYNMNGIVYSTDTNFKPEEKTEEETLPVHEQLLKVSNANRRIFRYRG